MPKEIQIAGALSAAMHVQPGQSSGLRVAVHDCDCVQTSFVVQRVQVKIVAAHLPCTSCTHSSSC